MTVCLLKNDPVTLSVLQNVSAFGADMKGNRVLIARSELSIQFRFGGIELVRSYV